MDDHNRHDDADAGPDDDSSDDDSLDGDAELDAMLDDAVDDGALDDGALNDEGDDLANDPADAAEQAAAEAADTVEQDIDALVAERDQYRDIALRLQADFENYRKRVAAQGDAEIDRATGKLAESLLPVLDACEAGFAHDPAGVEPIWSALMGALQRQGLEAMDLVGKPFDPSFADAVVHEPGDGAEPSVADVLRTGYVWKGRVLRPAMVKVHG